MKEVKADSKSQTAFLKEMLSKIRLDDPKVKLFIEQEFNNNRHSARAQGEINREIIRRLKIQNKKLLEQVASLKDQARQIRTDGNQIMNRLNELLKQNKSLSDALGSCSTCWGEDQECDNCSGSGSPGWRKINRRLFNMYVLPTVEKVYRLSKRI